MPETGNARHYARYFFPVIGRGAIGFSPFGMDATGYYNYPLGAKTLDDETIEAFAANYRCSRRSQREWARIAFEKQGVGRRRSRPMPQTKHDRRSIELGKYRATVDLRPPAIRQGRARRASRTLWRRS